MKVLDLFSGTQSVRKALDQMNIDYEYYGIDIYSPEAINVILDLSQDNIVKKLLNVLPRDWKPDFIWASPVCNKFSLASAVKGGNIYFEKTKKGIKIRENFEPLKTSVYKNMDQDKIKEDAKLHINLVNNMQKIIDYYNCDFIIENPYNSYIKNILNPLYIINKADYCMYGYDYKKPTALFSNYNFKMKTCNHDKHNTKIGSRTTKKQYGNDQKKVSNYTEKSSVPQKLIIDILNTILTTGEKDHISEVTI